MRAVGSLNSLLHLKNGCKVGLRTKGLSNMTIRSMTVTEARDSTKRCCRGISRILSFQELTKAAESYIKGCEHNELLY
ncbi:hypothetical protein RR46_11355 [Papilio xuthus]|uniref:Uncharacterized protein n=1 Tax=Papilio xuthus TaxID=66420 RepID=A0A194PQQ1_PAPXU|nr:hypothetical protein RR46_11355 [Papilio xuthus]